MLAPLKRGKHDDVEGMPEVMTTNRIVSVFVVACLSSFFRGSGKGKGWVGLSTDVVQLLTGGQDSQTNDFYCATLRCMEGMRPLLLRLFGDIAFQTTETWLYRS